MLVFYTETEGGTWSPYVLKVLKYVNAVKQLTKLFPRCVILFCDGTIYNNNLTKRWQSRENAGNRRLYKELKQSMEPSA